jgi:hypothetical protein
MQLSKKLSKVNHHPMGENSPNLVTLLTNQTLGAQFCFVACFFTQARIKGSVRH